MKLTDQMKVMPNQQNVIILDDNGSVYVNQEQVGEIKWAAVAAVLDCKVNEVMTNEDGSAVIVEVHQA
jgi:hypothetical protein